MDWLNFTFYARCRWLWLVFDGDGIGLLVWVLEQLEHEWTGRAQTNCR